MDNALKKRLVYHFFIPDNWKELETVQIHLKCLKHYSHIFDEAIFVLSLNDVNNKDNANEIQKILLDSGFDKNVTFKIVENTNLYESKTLYEEVTSKMDKLDGITFFGHSKGIGNELYKQVELDKLKVWIYGLYYFSLEFMNEVRSYMYGIHAITYGPFKTQIDETENKYKWFYSGTFFWINTQKLYDKIAYDNRTPRHFTDRFYSELYLGDVVKFKLENSTVNESISHNNAYLYGKNINYYDNTREYVTLLYSKGECDNFFNFINEIENEK